MLNTRRAVVKQISRGRGVQNWTRSAERGSEWRAAPSSNPARPRPSRGCGYHPRTAFGRKGCSRVEGETPMTATPAVTDAITSLTPLIREHADQIERERRLPGPVVRALVEAGVFRLYIPQALGGA